ncbi:glutaredoxin family protein [Nitrosovibrio tenuis]|uniref:Glutaredoxin-like domain n=1 Tax=Nitrosovibrio tenuis TaxID=1233 RepID=A0A1H7IEP0_9PROT|nr:glutaredoxin family protein [Nitrosovibrio tenuis]SEK59990.1 Glutaredoxin-like domain [Nitrosovibrio tenuis]
MAIASKSAAPDSPVLVVYGRENCHLCQNMLAALREWQERVCFHLEVVDVDSDDVLKSRYGERVPVLEAGGKEICHYYLDHVALDAYFSKIR